MAQKIVHYVVNAPDGQWLHIENGYMPIKLKHGSIFYEKGVAEMFPRWFFPVVEEVVDPEESGVMLLNEVKVEAPVEAEQAKPKKEAKPKKTGGKKKLISSFGSK